MADLNNQLAATRAEVARLSALCGDYETRLGLVADENARLAGVVSDQNAVNSDLTNNNMMLSNQLQSAEATAINTGVQNDNLRRSLNEQELATANAIAARNYAPLGLGYGNPYLGSRVGLRGAGLYGSYLY